MWMFGYKWLCIRLNKYNIKNILNTSELNFFEYME